MRIVVCTAKVPFIHGGAEILAEQLTANLRDSGHKAEITAIPFKWYPANALTDHMIANSLIDLTEANGNRVDLVIGLKFPAYLAKCHRMNLWLVHQHRQAYDLWDSGESELLHMTGGRAARDLIRNADFNALSRCANRFAISRNVASRLERYNGLGAEALYPPPTQPERFFSGPQRDYLFFPSRLGPLKRQLLVIQALAQTATSVNVAFAGSPDSDAYLESLKQEASRLGVSARVQFLGQVSEQEKIELYANCLGVIYPPQDEDYGYVSLEAMLAGKPLLTCTDSGGPLEFVLNDETGLISQPTAADLARSIDRLGEDPGRAVEMGEAARDHYADLDIGWKRVIECLTR